METPILLFFALKTVEICPSKVNIWFFTTTGIIKLFLLITEAEGRILL